MLFRKFLSVKKSCRAENVTHVSYDINLNSHVRCKTQTQTHTQRHSQHTSVDETTKFDRTKWIKQKSKFKYVLFVAYIIVYLKKRENKKGVHVKWINWCLTMRFESNWENKRKQQQYLYHHYVKVRKLRLLRSNRNHQVAGASIGAVHRMSREICFLFSYLTLFF